MKKLLVASLVGLVLVFGGCSDGGSSNTTDDSNTTVVIVNNIPVVTDTNISVSVIEYATVSLNLLTNVSDSDVNDTLSVVSVSQLDGNITLPEGYSFNDENLTIDATGINVADGVNLLNDLNVTVSDGEDNVSYIVNSVIQDIANDSLLTYTINIVNSIDSNATMDLNVSLVDSDGLSSNSLSYNILDRNNSNSVVYTGSLSDIGSDGNFSDSLDLASNSVVAGYYTFSMVVSPVVGGESPQGDVSITHDFQVLNLAPVWTATEYTGNAVADHTDTAQELLDLTGKASDVEGDTLTYSYDSIVSIPHVNDTDEWNSVNFYITSGKVYVDGLQTANPGYTGDVVIKIGVSDGVTTSYTNVRFSFTNI